jgi:hypothetical protein
MTRPVRRPRRVAFAELVAAATDHQCRPDKPRIALALESVRHIDHLIFAAPDLEDGVREVEARFGVRAAGGGQHLGQGTHNKLLALGPRTYLEIIAPDPAQPEPSGPRPYGVDGVTRSGLVGWAIACEDIDRAHDEALAAGHDPGEVIDGHRLTPDGTMLSWQATSSARTSGLVLFLISWGNTTHPAASAPSGLRLESLHIEHPDPESIVRVLRALGTDVAVVKAARTGIVARVVGPTGGFELR